MFKKYSGNIENKNQILVYSVLFIILIIGLFLRLTHVNYAVDIPFNYISDSRHYYHWAKRILDGKEFNEVYHQGPLYPFFLFTVFKIFGPSVYHPLMIQAILGTINCILIFILALNIFNNKWIAIGSSFVMSTYQPSIFYDGMLLMATLVTFIDLLFLILLIQACNTNKRSLWFLSGLLLGVSAIARGTVLFFIPFVLIIIISKFVKESYSNNITLKSAELHKECIYPIIYFLCGASIIWVVTLRNYIKGNDFVLLSANSGITFFEGNNRLANGQYMDPPGLDLNLDFSGKKIAEHIEKRELKPSEVSRFWINQSIEYIANSPGAYTKLLIKKMGLFWNKYEIPNAENFYFSKQYSKILQLPMFNFSIVGTLGLLGIIISLCYRLKKTKIVTLFLFSHFIAVSMFFITSRYRVPIFPILIIFMVFSIFHITNYLIVKKYLKFFIWCICGLFCLLFVSYPMNGLNYKQDYAASYDNLGVLSSQYGNYEQAHRYYKKAIKYDPTYALSYNNIGSLYFQVGQKIKAVEYWKKGLSVDPDEPLIHMNLGIAYYQNGDIEKAKKEFLLASKLMPYSITLREIEKELGLEFIGGGNT